MTMQEAATAQLTAHEPGSLKEPLEYPTSKQNQPKEAGKARRKGAVHAAPQPQGPPTDTHNSFAPAQSSASCGSGASGRFSWSVSWSTPSSTAALGVPAARMRKNTRNELHASRSVTHVKGTSDDCLSTVEQRKPLAHHAHTVPLAYTHGPAHSAFKLLGSQHNWTHPRKKDHPKHPLAGM